MLQCSMPTSFGPRRAHYYRRAMGSALTNFPKSSCSSASTRRLSRPRIKPWNSCGLLPVQTPAPIPRPGIDGCSRWRSRTGASHAREAGERDRAARDFDEAAQVAGSIAQDDQFYDDAQFQLACIANGRGELLSTDLARLVESEKNYEQAAQILTRLISKHKLIPHYREEMAATLCGRAAVRLAMNRIPDAQSDCEAALDHLAWLIGEQKRKGHRKTPSISAFLARCWIGRAGFISSGDGPQRVKSTHAQAVEKLSRAIVLDPARAADKVRLEGLRPARLSRKSESSGRDDDNSLPGAIRADALLLCWR